MADYFTNFSMVLLLPNREAQAYALDLAEKASRAYEGESLTTNLPDALKDVLEDWSFETARDHQSTDLWLHSSNGGVDAACRFIQHLLQRFNPTGSAHIEWSHDCSKLRTDAFGGGAAFITAKNIKTMTTGEWIQRQLQRHQQ